MEAQTRIVAYLNFDGNCSEAMKFYQSVLGGTLDIQTFGDAFGDAPEETKDRVIHARLQHGLIELMASDTNPNFGPPFVKGNNVHLSIQGSDEATLKDYFDKLAEGGNVSMPLQKQFWGDTFGMLTDRYGIQWMVNVSSQ